MFRGLTSLIRYQKQTMAEFWLNVWVKNRDSDSVERFLENIDVIKMNDGSLKPSIQPFRPADVSHSDVTDQDG